MEDGTARALLEHVPAVSSTHSAAWSGRGNASRHLCWHNKGLNSIFDLVVAASHSADACWTCAEPAQLMGLAAIQTKRTASQKHAARGAQN